MMNGFGRPRLYRIILRGECGQLMAAVLDGLLIESCQGWTSVMALVRDEPELYGLLDRFQDFALHVVSLNELGGDVLRSQAAGRPVESIRPRRATSEEWLKGAAAGDPAMLETTVDRATDNLEQSGLDMRAHAMARLAALVAGGEPGSAYIEHVATALDCGVTLDEIVGVLVALLPMVGAARVTACAAATVEASAALPQISRPGSLREAI
jgi:alkylhydroperoxidase/carboxymuconolactone decarboxylase family protein YurZ